MEVVQSSYEAMLIINCNEEAMEYFGRHPWPNTVAYFPLVDDATDTVNGITLTNSWTKDATIWRTFNTTVDYSNVTKIKESNFISVWIRINSWLYWTSCCTQLFDVWERPISYCTSHSQSQFRNSIHCNDTSNNRPYINTGMEQWTRYLYCAWYEDWKAYYWKNGVKQVISNNCKSTWGLGELIRVQGAGVNITLSDLRLESQLPSDEDTVKYFEKTKKNYWYT